MIADVDVDVVVACGSEEFSGVKDAVGSVKLVGSEVAKGVVIVVIVVWVSDELLFRSEHEGNFAETYVSFPNMMEDRLRKSQIFIEHEFGVEEEKPAAEEEENLHAKSLSKVVSKLISGM